MCDLSEISKNNEPMNWPKSNICIEALATETARNSSVQSIQIISREGVDEESHRTVKLDALRWRLSFYSFLFFL